MSKEKPEQFTELNYQFLTTVSVCADEFHPTALPDGWDYIPKEDGRHWLTKQTELAYYNFRANEQFRQHYFLRALEEYHFWVRKESREYYMAAALKRIPTSMRVFSMYSSDRNSHICAWLRDITYNNRACADRTATADRHVIAHRRARANPRFIADFNVARNVRTNCDMHIIANPAIMIDRGRRIDDAALSYYCTRIDDRARHYDCAASDLDVAHHCVRMD